MKLPPTKEVFICCLFLFFATDCFSQLQINQSQNAQDLAHKLVGDGVIISNATLTSSNIIATGFFYNLGGTNIGIDSGIALTNGRAKSDFRNNLIGLDGDGSFPASNISKRASADLGLPGDQDLANATGIPYNNLYDAVTLEFDVVPLGDTIQFKYVLSSEEYTYSTVCVYNDAFALLLSGPGISGQRNLAIVPGTNLPVTITNVNNIPAGCINNPQYYIDNTSNVYFTHDGHTAVFTAKSEVQPCQVYHLKFIIADRGDHIWDSGVFIEARSLSSDPVHIDNQTPLNQNNLPYVAEGCHTSSIHIIRNAKKPYPQTVNLSFGGTAINGVDVAMIASSYTIPADDSVVSVPIIPIADFIPEPNENLKIYVSSGSCSINGVYLDSIGIEIRDINLLLIDPGDTAVICRDGSVQFFAEAGYLAYKWIGPALNDPALENPVAIPPSSGINYICTATAGNCIAQDSVFVKWKTISLVSKTDIYCQNGTNGQITVAGTGWQNPVSYSINNQPYQSSSSFSNLSAGTYSIKLKDLTGCIDSIMVTLVQVFPNLDITTATTAASCNVDPDGTITITPTGGSGIYSFSIDGTAYQTNNVFVLPGGNYTVYEKDANGCLAQKPVTIALVNSIIVDAGADTIICEGTSYTIPATGNADSYLWSPAATLNNPSILNPVAGPSLSTQYFITASLGRCTKKDSVTINIRPAPVANAGADINICFGKTIQLHGSGGLSYQWTPATYFTTASNISDPSLKPQYSISYYLSVKDIYQCQSLKTDAVKVNVTPAVKLFAGRDTAIAIDQPLQLKVVELNNSGVNQYSWSPASFLNDSHLANPVAVLQYDMVYTVTGKTPDDCEGSDEIKVKVYQGPEIYVPKGFTPNGDGLNDKLKAIPVGMKEFHYFHIYDRWGQIIFSTKDPSRGWDGKINGIDQQNGTYIWMAEAVDFKGNAVLRKGTITIVR